MRTLVMLIFLSKVACFPRPVFATEKVLNLSETVQHAVSHAARLRGGRAQRTIAELDLATAKTHNLPNVTSEFTTGLSGANDNNDPDRKIGSPTYQSGLEVKLSKTIWDGGDGSYRFEAATLSDQLAVVAFTESRDQLILDIVRNFLNYSGAVVALESQSEHLALLERQERTSGEAFRQGLRTKRDHMQLQTQVQRNQMAVMTAKNSIETHIDAIKSLIGATDGSLGSAQFVPVKHRSELEGHAGNAQEADGIKRQCAFVGLADALAAANTGPHKAPTTTTPVTRTINVSAV